jgi:hypothetical protein
VSDTRPRLGATVTFPRLAESDIELVQHLDALAENGVRTLYLDMSWELLQLSPGRLDGSTAERYERVIAQASGLEMEVWARLHAGHQPQWFSSEGGFSDDKATAKWWPRWVEVAADRFGGQVTGFVPISDPFGQAARWSSDPKRHSDAMRNVALAWRDSWRILRGGTLVATELHLRLDRPANDSVEAAQAARQLDMLRWRLWMRSLRDGAFVLPGRFDSVIPDLAGSVDVLGFVTSTDIVGAVTDQSVARWRERVGTIIRRVGEEGPDRPLHAAFSIAWPHASERLALTEATADAVSDAIDDRIPLAAIIVHPGIDRGDSGSEGGLIGRDRLALPTTQLWHNLAS